MSSVAAPLLEVREITKRFGGVHALSGVSLHLHAGEALGVVGENGAGKSTLMKIVAGVHQPDSGTILFEGKELRLAGVADALQTGISLIHQELNLAENLTVAANIFLGREKTSGGILGWLNRSEMAEAAKLLMARVGLAPELVHATVSQLPPGQKQLVEIARALSLSARILIMDEPTSSLTQTETDRLYEVIDELKRQGVGILYISHRLAEVKRVCDRVTVLRDGRNAGDLAKEEISADAIVKRMIGRDLKQIYPHARTVPESVAPLLEVRDFRYRGGPDHPISFRLRPGEVLGMAGLVGAGRTELAEAIFGIRPVLSGQILLRGTPVSWKNPTNAIEAGVALIPEDRRFHGLILEESIRFNISLPNLEKLDWLKLVLSSQEKTMAEEQRQSLSIRSDGIRQAAGELSGGNQQKVVLGKWLARKPQVLILDEPTRGVDVGARSEIYLLIDALAASGVAIWMISSDLEEVLGMSDRVLVLHEGRLAGELARTEMNEEAVMRLATGAGSHS